MNVLPVDDRLGTLSSSEFQCVWEALQEVLVVEHTVEGGAPAAEQLREEEEEEEAFWRRLDLEMGEELELGPPPLNVQLEEAGWWVPWGPELQPAQEGPPMSPLGLELMEVDGAKQAP